MILYLETEGVRASDHNPSEGGDSAAGLVMVISDEGAAKDDAGSVG